MRARQILAEIRDLREDTRDARGDTRDIRADTREIIADLRELRRESKEERAEMRGLMVAVMEAFHGHQVAMGRMLEALVELRDESKAHTRAILDRLDNGGSAPAES